MPKKVGGKGRNLVSGSLKKKDCNTHQMVLGHVLSSPQKLVHKRWYLCNHKTILVFITVHNRFNLHVCFLQTIKLSNNCVFPKFKRCFGKLQWLWGQKDARNRMTRLVDFDQFCGGASIKSCGHTTQPSESIQVLRRLGVTESKVW